MAEYNIEGNSIDQRLLDSVIDNALSFQPIPTTTEVVILEAPDVEKTYSLLPPDMEPYESPTLSALNPTRRSRPKWYTRFFEPIPGSQQKRHRCVECGWEGMAIPESLSNLKRHFTFKKYNDCKLKFIGWEAENAIVSKSHTDHKPFTGSVEYDNSRLPQNKDRPSDDVYLKLANFVVSAEIPLSTVDCPEFLSFCQALNPQYTLPYSSTVKSLMEKIKSSGDEAIQNELNLSQVVTLSIDGWSSPRLLSMIAVIVNYQTPNSIAKSELIGVELFRGDHSEESIANFILDVSKSWGIEGKIVRIGLDRKSQNIINKTLELKEEFLDKSAAPSESDGECEEPPDLEEISDELVNPAALNVFFKLNTTTPDSVLTRLRTHGLLPISSPCVRHSIQLVINEFLKSQLGFYGPVDKLISKANSYVRSVKNMPSCSQLFAEHKLELVTMNVSRWDTMYQMVQSLIAAEERGVLNMLSEAKSPSPPNSYEFSILREIATALEPLHLFTLELQYSQGCSSIIIPALKLIHEELGQSVKQEDSSVPISEHRSPLDLLNSAVLSQFREVTQDNFLIIANCLDPRFAAKALETPNSMNLLTHAMKAMIEIESVGEVPEACAEIPQAKRRKSLFDSFRENSSKIPDSDRINMEVTAFKAESNLVAGVAEVDPYLWWERKTTQFPILFKLSRIYLIPAESICEERVLSLVSRIYSRYPTRSSVDTVHLLATLRFRMLRLERKVSEN